MGRAIGGGGVFTGICRIGQDCCGGCVKLTFILINCVLRGCCRWLVVLLALVLVVLSVGGFWLRCVGTGLLVTRYGGQSLS